VQGETETRIYSVVVRVTEQAVVFEVYAHLVSGYKLVTLSIVRRG
jgi:hypothetical protein